MSLSLAPIGHWIVVVLLATFLAGSLAWGPSKTRTTPSRRRVLLALRTAVILLALLAMLRPTVVYTSVKKQSATLVLLLDRSRSMLVGDAVGDQSRWNAMGGALQASQSELSQLAEDLQIKVYTFAEQLEPVALDQGQLALADVKPDGSETAIGTALETVLEREEGQRLAAVLLLSDGAQRAAPGNDLPPQNAARQLADLGYPLHTFSLGQPRSLGDARDVAMRQLQLSSPAVFVKNRLTVQGSVQVDGYANQQIPVQLLFENPSGEMVAVNSTTVSTAEEGQTLPVELSYIPTIPGQFKVTLKAVEQPGELVKTNNELSTFVTVLKGGLNVLYLEGVRRVESKFISQALDRAADIKVTYELVDPAAQGNEMQVATRLQAPTDVYILGDIDSSAFTADQLALIARRVNEGAGLIMLGGLQSFGPGGYGATPLAEVLPILMEPFERQRLDEPPRADLHIDEDSPMRPTDLGRRHFIMLLGAPADSDAIWASLPPLEGANAFRKLQPRANILATGPAEQPLLVAQDVGRGRVLAFAGDSTWRWALAGQQAAQQRFWRQIVLWLAHKEQATDNELWVDLDPRRYAPRQRVEFTAGARTPAGEAMTGLAWSGVVTTPDGTQRPVRLAPDGDHQRGSFTETTAPGDYRIRLTATREGKEIGQTETRFLVFDQDLELDNPAADPSLLANISAITGGESLPAEQLPELLAKLRKTPPPLEVERETKYALWDNWPFMLLFATLLSTEWFLRKRWGLI